MTLDLVIRNGTIVDGSGMGRYRADVGVADGRIVEIGRIRAPAQRSIDADGLIVAPGFIDGHTHMDAQVNWDRQGTCSCWHGVTSVIMGNCGFALAPCPPDEREWFARCLTAVEDIPLEAMLVGHRLAVGDVPGVPRHRRTAAEGAELRCLYRPFGAAHVRDGQARADRTGDRGRCRAHGARSEASGARRRDGIFQFARRHACHAGRHAGRQPDRGLERDRRSGRRDGGTGRRNLPGGA